MVVMEDDNESCGSRIVETSPRDSRNQRHKLEVYNEVLLRLKDSDEARLPGFCDDLWAHFNRLPARYALDVNVERAEDVLTHKMLLQQAVDLAKRPAFDVRVVQVLPAVHTEGLQGEEKSRTHPPPAFGSSTNLRALSLESNKVQVEDGDAIISTADHMLPRPMHEITFSADDRPKLLSQLTSLLAEIGLNIQEAHAFSTNDGYSIDVFLVEGWPYEETVQLKEEIRKEIQKLENKPQLKLQTSSASEGQASISARLPLDHVKISTDGADVWEIDIKQLNFEKIVASGSYGDLYRGTYCSQDVAIKVLKPERVNVDMQREFAQEVFIMRKVRHKNVVQFIGACTKPPTLCIVTEFMSGGSVYDILHKHKGVFKVPAALRVAIDVSKGMNYLHQNNIIHRDLKAANLLMDENDVVKVADFGVARVKCQSGVMTAETGTYRWMAPEVIEHKPYDHKADVFSFAIVLWELLTGKIPHEYLTPLQAAVGVVQKSLRPTIPKSTNPRLVDLLQRCWQQDPSQRPDFSEILEILQDIAKEVECEQDERRRDKSIRGFFSVLRRS